MNAARIQIEQLHELYQNLTGHQLFLNMSREMEWFAWLKWRRPPFTADDLRLVVTLIRRGIKEQKRNEGALKFSNLIGMPDRFEEDLALARALNRPKPPAVKTVSTPSVGTQTNRIVPTNGTEDTARPVADVIANIQKLKDAAK